MKKKFKMEDLDCANCAAKMENAIKAIPGVRDASVSFMAQKLTIDGDDDSFEEIVRAAVKCVSDVDPACRVIV